MKSLQELQAEETAMGTMVTLTSYHRLFVVIAGISLPLFLLIGSGVLWFRRRGA